VIKLEKAKLSKRELKAKRMLADARAQFGREINGHPIKYSVCTDDGGTLFEAFVEDSKAADILRNLIPKKFYGMRTCVSFMDVQEEEEDPNFYYSDDE
jgi:hypothetical protein